jgi:hypothetical protein
MTNDGLSSGPKLPSLLRRIGLSVLLCFGLVMIGGVLERVLGPQGFTGTNIYLDNVVIGVIAGVVVFAYEQRRYKAIREKIATISAMNHHVRNALQGISYAPYTDQAKQIQLIQQSVNRIQWALREVLPGALEVPIQVPETKDAAVGDKGPA